jgi:low temperature requirement protein LtrA
VRTKPEDRVSAAGGSTGAEPDGAEKRVTWAELFFDLVFVFAITQVTALLHHDHSWAGIGEALIVFVPIWWAWVGTTIHANRHDVDTAHDTLGIFIVGLGSLGMALALPGAYGDRGVLFGASYLFLRIVLGVLVFRDWRGISLNSFSVGVAVTGPLLLIGGLTTGTPRLVLWALAAATDLLTPRLLRNRLAGVRFETNHLPERFGLFLIIALGESVVQVGGVAASTGPLSAPRLGATVAAYVLVCSLWWVYFIFAARAVRFALTEARVHTDLIRPVFSYGHLLFICGIIAAAVGLGEVVRDPVSPLPWSPAGLLVGGCALYLATFGYTRWRMFRAVSWTRLSGALICLAALPVARFGSGLAGLLALVAVTVGLNVTEAVIVRRRERAGQVVEEEPDGVSITD